MSTATATASPELSELSTQELSDRRHDLANEIQRLQFRLWALDDERERRQRARSISSLRVVPSESSLVQVEGVDTGYPELVS